MNRKLINGIGVNDLGSSTLEGKQDPHYGLWTAMLKRVAPSSKYQAWYSDTSICQEWLYRSAFQEWLVSQPAYPTWCDGRLGKGYFNIDKDILSEGVSIYSPETCSFVPAHINKAILLSRARRTENPLGVYYDKRPNHCKSERRKPYRSEMGGKFLGNFEKALDAHRAWQLCKIEHLNNLVVEYDRKTFKDKRVVDKLFAIIENVSIQIVEGVETKHFLCSQDSPKRFSGAFFM